MHECRCRFPDVNQFASALFKANTEITHWLHHIPAMHEKDAGDTMAVNQYGQKFNECV